MAQPKDAAGSGDESAMRIDAALVQHLAELLTENELTEIEVQDGERKIRVVREPAPVIAAAPAVVFAFYKIFGLDANSSVGVGNF